MKTVLFIGKSHFISDPRLYHRIAKELNKRQYDVHWIDFHASNTSPSDLTVHQAISFWDCLKTISTIKPEIVQISDPRECLFGLYAKLCTSAKLVYDSHEDFYGQHTIRWRQTRNPVYVVTRYVLWFLNLFNAFISDITLSTDEYGTEHLKKVQKNVHFLPNFVNDLELLPQKSSFDSVNTDSLRFLCVGSYNPGRGLFECLDFIEKYNSKHGTNHTLHIFGLKDKFPDTFKDNPICTFNGYQPLDKLYQSMIHYDIGVCLLLDRKKYHRNIPIKILEYMALGLPVLTSNFGYMQSHAVDHGAGVGISPTSYTEFEQALIHFQSKDELRTYSENGIRFSKKHRFEDIFRETYERALT